MEKLIIIISSVLLLAFLCWKEYHRKNKAHLSLRIAASLLAVMALYFIAVPLSFQRNPDPAKENTAVLLTEGFNKDSLAKLNNIPLFTTEQSIAAKNKNVSFIPDLAYFAGTEADINTVHILGNGLDTHELQALSGHRLVFHPSTVSGLAAVHWNHTIRSGDHLSIQGTYNNTSRPVKLLLKGLSTTLDSVNIPAEHSQTFELSTSPKLLGKAIYSLIALSGMDTLANEKLPVTIEAKQALRILILASSPDFENKFLKSWLYAEKYSLAIRTSISKDKYSTEFLNTGKISLNRITPALLQNFDILSADLTELSRLSAAENSAIQNQLSSGMGLLIRADVAGGTGFYKRAFNIRQNKNIDQKTASLHWDKRKAAKTSSPSAANLEIIPANGEQVLVKDSKNHALVSSKLFGAGRMIVTTVTDTYTWMLSNNTTDYSSYWSYILEKAARKTELKESWAHDGFPSVNEQISLRLETNTDSLPSAAAQNTALHFSQNPAMFFRWTAEHWPSESGWQSIRSGNKESSWYVFDKKDWQSVRAVQKVKNTERFISGSKKIAQQTGNFIRIYTYTIPAIYFYVLFLVACGYLWVEGKME